MYFNQLLYIITPQILIINSARNNIFTIYIFLCTTIHDMHQESTFVHYVLQSNILIISQPTKINLINFILIRNFK